MISLSDRLERCYTAAIHDVMRVHGLTDFVLTYDIRALFPDSKIGGPAFTFRGRTDPAITPHDTYLAWTKLLGSNAARALSEFVFVIAIPFLVIFALLPVPGEPFRELHALDKLTWLLFTTGSVLGLFGIACLFWFVRPLFGCAFALSSIVAYGFLLFRCLGR